MAMPLSLSFRSGIPASGLGIDTQGAFWTLEVSCPHLGPASRKADRACRCSHHSLYKSKNHELEPRKQRDWGFTPSPATH